MGQPWTDQTIDAPGSARIDGTDIHLDLDAPMVNRMRFVFADLYLDATPAGRMLLEPTVTVVLDGIRLRITDITETAVTVQWQPARPGLFHRRHTRILTPR